MIKKVPILKTWKPAIKNANNEVNLLVSQSRENRPNASPGTKKETHWPNTEKNEILNNFISWEHPETLPPEYLTVLSDIFTHLNV